MDLKVFIKQHRDDWDRLEQSIKVVSKRRRKQLSPEKVDEFQHLYQKSAHHLSVAQTYFPRDEVTYYLNGLVSKAHNLLYRDQATSLYQLRRFFGGTFIRLFWEQRAFILIAMLLFTIGAVGGYLSVLSDPLHVYTLLGPEMAAGIDPEQIGKHDNDDGVGINSPLMSTAIMTNNIQVAILAFAGGITLGLFTVYVLITNGILVGALAAVFWQHGKFYEFWAYIVPHGMIELTAIFIAGGAGLLMGYKMIVPGPYSRAFQLKHQALRSVQLLLGTVPLFVVAGIIEGYITPAPISLEMKYTFALVTVFALIFYILIGKRKAIATGRG
ncbi:stage II sporulation protein M [Pseudoneobacillus sp. C159]